MWCWVYCESCCPVPWFKKKTWVFSSSRGVYSVCKVGHSALQSLKFVCVEHGYTLCIAIHKAHFPPSPHSAQLVCLHCTLTCRAAERIRGAQGKYKKGGPYYRLWEGVWGHAPKEILRFYVLRIVFWGLMRHTGYTKIFINTVGLVSELPICFKTMQKEHCGVPTQLCK